MAFQTSLLIGAKPAAVMGTSKFPGIERSAWGESKKGKDPPLLVFTMYQFMPLQTVRFCKDLGAFRKIAGKDLFFLQTRNSDQTNEA
jgi:hypothetical protein